MRALWRVVRECPSLLLFLDYDGTLVPIRPRPEMARLHPRRRSVLEAVARRHPTAVVSGRSLSDIRSHVGLPRIAYAGNHGLEIQRGRRRWIHPEAVKTALLIKQIVTEAERRLKTIPGTEVEDKKFSASIHFRRAQRSDEPEIRRILNDLVPPGRRSLRMTEGKKVIEIRPAVDWDKGRAVLLMKAMMDPRAIAVPLVIGDDRTDEDAFRALADQGITVSVGRKKQTAARFRLPDVDAVWDFLRALLQR